MRRMLLVAGLALSLALALAPWGTSQEWPDFQTDGFGPQPWFVDVGQGKGERHIGGLGMEVSVEGWPRLFKRPVPYYSVTAGESSDQRRPLLDFGVISPTGAQPGGFTLTGRDWAHVAVRLAPQQAGEPLELWVTRLSPAVAARTQARSLTLFGGEGAARPAFLATPGADGVVVRPAGQAGELPRDALSRSWLLVWFGEQAGLQSTRFPYSYQVRSWIRPPASPVDCPFLLIFENAPAAIQAQATGLRLDFDGPAGSLALLPLFGDAYPPVAETAKWADGLPAEVSESCDWWARHLCELPLTARETYARSEGEDSVSATCAVEFLKVRDGGERFGPLPPMLALGLRSALPVKLSGTLKATSVQTAVGPYVGLEGANQYAWRVTGLGKYVTQGRTAAAKANEPPRLAEMLRAEIEKIIPAGHLAPWYPATNDYGAGYLVYWMHQSRLVWANPGENLFYLLEALPLLKPDQRGKLSAYLAQERANYPPERIAHTSIKDGARRERYRLENQELLAQHDEKIKALNFYVVNGLIPEENLYYLAGYYQATGAADLAQQWPALQELLWPYLRRQDWATLGWYAWPVPYPEFDGFGGVVDANHHLAALVGALRLARMVGDAQSEKLLWGQLARAAILRCALSRYAEYLVDSRLIELPDDPAWMVKYMAGSWTGRLYTYHWTSARDDVRSIVHLNQFGVQFDDVMTYYSGKGLLPYRGMVPELARLLADYDRPWAQTYADRVAQNMPDWYLALCTANMGAEYNYLVPEDSYQVFMARAWVLGEPGPKLAGYLDVPWMARGDLYYVHKLAETIKAYRGVRWETLNLPRAAGAGQAIQMLNLAGAWRFSLDPQARGEEQGWAGPDFDDSQWLRLRVPGNWEDQGVTQAQPGSFGADYADLRATNTRPFDGIAWYRLQITIPAAWRGKRVSLELGAVDDFDRTFLNGRLVGHTDRSASPDDWWRARRTYALPQDVIRFGQQNTIAIEVFDFNDVGGIMDYPVRLLARP